MTARPQLVLASASPARLLTLRAAGLHPLVRVSGVPEDVIDGEPPAATAQRLAVRKADAVASTVDPADVSAGGPVLVLGCDSVLDLDGVAVVKPSSAAVAAARWRSMRGRDGVLHTGHRLIRLDADAPRQHVDAVASTVVRFAEPSDEEIDAYVATGEPLHVAGGFTIDGLGAAFVRGVDGDPSNVVGVSLPLLRDLASRLGVAWPDLWR